MKKKFSSIFLALVSISLVIQPYYVFAEETPVEFSPVVEENTLIETTSSTVEISKPIPQENADEIADPLPIVDATLRIETTNGVIFNHTLTVTACKPYDTATEYTLNAKCLIDQASGLASIWNYFGTDAFLNSVNEYENDFGTNLFWGYFINQEYGTVALNTYIVHQGDEILLVYGVNPLKIEMDTTEPILNTTTTVHVYEFGLDENWNPVWLPSNSGTVAVDGITVATTENGHAQITFTTHGNHTIQATKTGFAPSEVESITDILPTTTAKLYAVAGNNILFNQTLTVTACKPYDTATEYTLNAKCLIDQASGLASIWNYFGTDAFLNSVNEYENDFGANLFWGYFINQEYGTVALNTYIVHQGDEVLIQYNNIPLKFELSTTTPKVGENVVISFSEFGLDENWNPVWKPTTDTVLSINGETQMVTTSSISFTITTTTPYIIRAEKVGYVPYEKTLVAGEAKIVPDNTGHNGSGNGSSCCTINAGAAGMIQFLDAKQNADGSFGASAFLNDWTAIAYGAWDGAQTGKSKLTAYLLNDPTPLDGPNKTTNYARRAMGLMSLGINPYTGTKTNYIQALISGFDGNQFGDAGLINDDIFALIPLLRAGYTSEDAFVASTTKFIIANQNTNGSFGSIDLTAAGIQALQPLESINGVTDALARARTYLHTAQSNDGGFGNVYATAWAMQAISTLGENQENWIVNTYTPLSYISNTQAVDGGLMKNDSMSNRIWATANALPAILGKSWNTILSSFEKPDTNSNTASGSSNESNSTSSTPGTNTTTPQLIMTPTSTPTSTIVITPIDDIDTLTEEAQLYTYTTQTAVQTEHPSVQKPSTAILGEKEVNTSTNQTTLNNRAENIQTSNTTTRTAGNSQTKKYLFITSLIIFLGLSGYMAFKHKS